MPFLIHPALMGALFCKMSTESLAWMMKQNELEGMRLPTSFRFTSGLVSSMKLKLTSNPCSTSTFSPIHTLALLLSLDYCDAYSERCYLFTFAKGWVLFTLPHSIKRAMSLNESNLNPLERTQRRYRSNIPAFYLL